MKKLISYSAVSLALLTPLVASAQLSGTLNLIENAKYIVNLLTILVSGIALLVFFFGLVKFIFKIGGDAKAAQEGRTLMIWGTIALFVMVSVWGLVNFIQNELIPGYNNSNPNVPGFNG